MLRKARIFCCALAVCVALSACRKDVSRQEQPQATVNIAYSTFAYEQGYAPAEGWMYETRLTDAQQMAELNRLMEEIHFEVTEDTFELGRGYQIVWHDAEGGVTREELILSESKATREGMIFQVTGAQALYEWLEALKLSEQTAG